MNTPSEREQVLLALVGCDDGQLSRHDLMAALDAWASDPQKQLFELLIERKALTADQLDALLAASSFASSTAASSDDALDAVLRGALPDGVKSTSSAANADGTPKITHSHRHGAAHAATETNERFLIGEAHAHGGLGEVLRATDLQLDREVAVKRIRALWADDADSRARFMQEARITGRLEHPGIVPVYALAFEADGRPYYAMRFIGGDNLEQMIARYYREHHTGEDRLAFNVLLQHFVDVCNTIEYAHSRGVIHRDLKPANIMLGEYGETVVVDWGMAKQLDQAGEETHATSIRAKADGSTPTQYGRAVGTPQYMSPEQAAGLIDQQGAASDIFSLGATLYHLLTGRPAYEPGDSDEVVRRAAVGEFVPPRAVRAGVPKPLEAICLKAMARQAEDRYRSAAELGRDVQRWLADEPVTAYRDPWTGRLARWTRNHSAQVAAMVVGGVLLMLSTFAGLATWSYVEREQYRAQLELESQERTRLAELESSATAAREFADAELAASRYASALGTLENAQSRLADEPELAALYDEFAARSSRLRRIVEFHRLSELSGRLLYLGREPQALAHTESAVETLDFVSHGDWWNHLPTDDLTEEQVDDLRWDAYNALMMLTSLYASAVNRELASGSENVVQAFMSDRGKPEARAARAADRMVQRFRPSEANRWLADAVGMRLGLPVTVFPRDLGPPHHASDAYTIGILSQFAAGNPDFPFRGYRGSKDPLASASEAFRLSSQLQPDDFWTHLFLGFIEMSLAQRDLEEGDPQAWLRFADARQALGRAIALNPDYPFAYAERSVAQWREAKALAAAGDDDAQRERIDVLRGLAVRDARRARDLDPDNAWWYWYEGHATQEIGEDDEAAAAYLQAIRLDWEFGGTTDYRHVVGEQVRAIPEAIDWAEERLAAGEDAPWLKVMLAATLLARDDDDSDKIAELLGSAIGADPLPEYVYSVRGMSHFRNGAHEEAMADFRRASELDGYDVWAALGIADCLAAQGEYAAAVDAYQRAFEVARAESHRASARLGGCRMLLKLGRFDEAASALAEARAMEVECDITDLLELANELGAQPVLDVVTETKHKVMEVMLEPVDEHVCPTLPLLNGGFELGLSRYWGHDREAAPIWWARGNCRAKAEIDRETRHTGTAALHIYNRASGTVDDYASTTQTVPAAVPGKFRLTAWVKTSQLEPGAFRIEVDPVDGGVARIDGPAGTADWQQVACEFSLPADSNRVFNPLTVTIFSSGVGDVWLDDLRLERLSSP